MDRAADNELAFILDNADNLNISKKLPDYQTDQGQLQGPELLNFVPKRYKGKWTVIWISRDGGIVGELVGPNRGIQIVAMTTEESLRTFWNLSGISHLDK